MNAPGHGKYGNLFFCIRCSVSCQSNCVSYFTHKAFLFLNTQDLPDLEDIEDTDATDNNPAPKSTEKVRNQIIYLPIVLNRLFKYDITPGLQKM